jgi:hypothetical protein
MDEGALDLRVFGRLAQQFYASGGEPCGRLLLIKKK